MKKIDSKRFFLPFCALLSITGCGSSEDKATAIDTGTPSVVASDSDTLAISGKLAIEDSTGLGLAADGSGLLAVTLNGGTPIGDPEDITVGSDGSFSYSLSKVNDQVDSINTEMAKDVADWDWNLLAELASDLFGESVTASQLQEIGAEQVKTYMEQFATQLETLGTTTLLISYTPSDDIVAEANSFSFIGLPTAGGKNLIALSNQAILGNLTLGDITAGSNGEGQAELDAESSFNLSEKVIDNLADNGKALKDFKNLYMNDDWKIETFWAWMGTKANAINQYSSVDTLEYNGVGFYIGSSTATPFVYEQLCGANPGSLTFTPPEEVSVKSGDETISTFTEFSNSGATQDTQGDDRICSGNSFYGREDGTNEFMINFGTGGGIQGDLPSGIWRMKWQDSEIARFDVALAKPFDSDNKPTVFIPSAKFITANDQITGVSIKFYVWNGSAYEEMTDITAVKRLVSQINASITKSDTNGEERGQATFANETTTEASLTFENPVSTANASYLSVSFTIGTANYRTEFR